MAGAAEREPGKMFDLEDRTYRFAERVRDLLRGVEKTVSNVEDLKQLARSSGSVGANYIEANEAPGKKDFLLHIRIGRKEAKESRYWLRLLRIPAGSPADIERNALAQEADELKLILSAIIRNSGGER
jgi:four helix bundle protein